MQPVFECTARKQSLPEPADCNWPVCGCDAYASKVLDAITESGFEIVPAKQRDSLALVISDLRKNPTGSDTYPWGFAAKVADRLEKLMSGSDPQ